MVCRKRSLTRSILATPLGCGACRRATPPTSTQPTSARRNPMPGFPVVVGGTEPAILLAATRRRRASRPRRQARTRCIWFPFRGAARRPERASRPGASRAAVSVSLLQSRRRRIGTHPLSQPAQRFSPGLRPAAPMYDLITHNPHPVPSPSRKATPWDRKRLLNRFESGTKRRAGRQISAERLRCSSNMSLVRNQDVRWRTRLGESRAGARPQHWGNLEAFSQDIGNLLEGGRGQRRPTAASAFSAGTPERRTPGGPVGMLVHGWPWFHGRDRVVGR